MLIEWDFFRYWGEWIARNVYVVVAVATIVILILCTGLLRFSVETDLEKVSMAFVFLESYYRFKSCFSKF